MYIMPVLVTIPLHRHVFIAAMHVKRHHGAKTVLIAARYIAQLYDYN